MIYNCEYCKYNTTLKHCYDRHLHSVKHKLIESSPDTCFENKCKKCNKILLSKTSLWRHNKTCSGSLSPENTIVSNDLLKQLINEQTIMKQLIIELSKNQPPTIINNDNSTKFNLSVFFLNPVKPPPRG